MRPSISRVDLRIWRTQSRQIPPTHSCRPCHDRVVVHREAIDVPAPRVLLIGLHDGFGPIGPARPVAAWAHGDLQHLLLVLLRRIEVPDEAAVDLHLAHVVLGRHVAAAVPAFVADSEKSDFVRRWVTVGGAFFGQRRRLLRPSCIPATRPLPAACPNRH